MKSKKIIYVAISAITLLANGLPAVAADFGNARNFLTVATGSVPSPDDPRIRDVQKQLERIEAACSKTSHGAGIQDKLGKGSSMVNGSVPLLLLLADFTRIATAQCKTIDDSTLISLYVLERNSGRSHASAIAALRTDPKALIAKWNNK